jgi:formylmethanofuran:tetrahydromethanopterin formyltransferase
MIINGVSIDETFAEAFPMKATRAIITAQNEKWAMISAQAMPIIQRINPALICAMAVFVSAIFNSIFNSVSVKSCLVANSELRI